MMREAQTPQEGCGLSREGSSAPSGAPGSPARFRAPPHRDDDGPAAADAALAQTAGATGDPSAPSSKRRSNRPSRRQSQRFSARSTPRSTGRNRCGLQGDQLIYDKAGNRVIARGNVEIYYNNYILTADEVVYDQGAGTLTAVGNVTLKEPQGNIVHADRYTLTDDFRDGFVQSLSIVDAGSSRASPPIAPSRRERQCHRIRERQVHAL